MKKTSLPMLIIVLFSLFIVSSVQAQLPTNQIETLIVDLWPDYDQDKVLVMFTGTLPADTPLPASVTIPLPEEAQINAIARITSDNRMLDDIQYTTGDNALTFTTPDSRFRVEYYVPYETTGSAHSYTFNWLADLRVNELLAAVQQPTGAANMTVTPENAARIPDNTDGFTYYSFPPQPIPGGELYTITFSYDMASPQLSIDNLPAPAAIPVNASTPAAAAPTTSPLTTNMVNWPLVLGVLGLLVIAVAGTWLVATRQTGGSVQKSRKPRPKRSQNQPAGSSGKAQFCHECGTALNAGDKFCRKCGTAVKSR